MQFVISVDNDCFRAPEPLFQPTLLEKEAFGVHEMIYNSITKCDKGIQTELFGNVVLSGGNTLFPGIGDRIKKELTALAPSVKEIKVAALPDRQYFTWIGASVLSSKPNFSQLWISKQEYEEHGPSILSKKCTS